MDDDFGFWDLIVSMFWFVLLLAWIWLFISIIGDIFRDRELSGVAKAVWTVVLVFLPWLGSLIYLCVRGGSMHERSVRAAHDNEARVRAYVQDAAGRSSVADDLRNLAALRDDGTLTPEEYEQAKAKVLA